MIDLILKVKNDFNFYPNELLPINSQYILKDRACAFGVLSKTNIFIGENNSGKSRFLRYLFQNDFWCIDSKGVDNLFLSLKKSLRNIDFFKDEDCLSKLIFLYEECKNGHTYYSDTFEKFFRYLEKSSYKYSSKNKYYFPTIRGVKDYKTILDGKLRSFSNSVTSIQNKDSINHYISLLNLEEEGLGSFDIYREITLHEYFSKHNLNILTGGTLYGQIKSMLLGKEADRTLISEFQLFLRNNFFIEYDTVQLIPNEKEKVVYVKIGDDERPIYDWGDGTQQLIIILFSLFIHKDDKETLFFIEEPEIYLHPGMLRKFIEVINSDIFLNHQYFITTHSNIILDTSADSDINMSIFKFMKNKNDDANSSRFIVEQCNNGDVSLLNALGVRNSSVFLANCSIWVEGITDRLYLKHYLNLYFKKLGKSNPYRENIDYTFIEYGGGNIVHFNFDNQDSKDAINAKYINNRIFLIVDNDNTKENTAKYKRKKHLKEILGDNFYELKVTEMENLLPQIAIEGVLIKQNPEHEIEIKQKFSKERNYKCERLGNYLDNKLFRGINIKKYSAESGTIKNKLAFCKSTIEFITDYDMLTDEAKELVEKIIAFIKLNS